MARAFGKMGGHCVLCGKPRQEVEKLILGVHGGVCLLCIELCNDIIQSELGKPVVADTAGQDRVSAEAEQPFDERAGRSLQYIVSRYGRSACENQPLIIGLLRRLCSAETKREVHVLVTALTEGVVAELISIPGGVTAATLHERLMRQLVADTAMSVEAARWAVRTWAEALAASPTTESV